MKKNKKDGKDVSRVVGVRKEKEVLDEERRKSRRENLEKEKPKRERFVRGISMSVLP